MPRAPQAAGGTGLTSDPGGAFTVIGLMYPWQLGTSLAMIERRDVYTAALENGTGELMPPLT